MHLWVTFYALGDERWDYWNYTPTIWAVIGFGVALLVPRAMWHLGIWRYVHTRDAGKVNITAGVPSDRDVSQVKTE